MTVKEAKTKVCPFMVDFHKQNVPCEAGDNQFPINSNCICGDCMAWEVMFTKKKAKSLIPLLIVVNDYMTGRGKAK